MSINNAVNTSLGGQTGTGAFVGSTSATLTTPSLITPALGSPSSGILTSCTGLPITTGVSGLGSGVISALIATVNGTGAISLTTSPTFITPLLGTPTSGTLTNCTGLPITTGVSGLGTGVATFLATPSSANLASAVTDETGSGSLVFATSPTLVTPVLGTPTSGTLTNCTGLPVATGISGLGTGVATFLATPSSANLASAVTDETGSGALVFATSPTLVTPTLGAASATSLTFSSTTGIVGTTTNNNAAAGSVGEFISSTVLAGSAVSITTGTPANVTTISLTAGDWDVWANVWVAFSAAATLIIGGINTVSATFPTAPGGGAYSQFNITSFTSSGANGVPVGMVRQSLSGTTTIYLVVQASFVSTASAFGFLGARRVR